MLSPPWEIFIPPAAVRKLSTRQKADLLEKATICVRWGLRIYKRYSEWGKSFILPI